MDSTRVLVVALALALVAGAAAWRARTRRAGFTPRLAVVPLALVRVDAPLTFLYFTSRLCGACRDTPDVARAAAPELPIVALPIHEHAGLARALGVSETPTIILADSEGRIRYARAGNPEPGELWTYVREAWDSLDAEGRLVRRGAATT